jgi:hypothetical protein
VKKRETAENEKLLMDLEGMKEDEELMRGLTELNQKDQQDLEKKKAVPAEGQASQGQGDQQIDSSVGKEVPKQESKKNDESDSGNYGMIAVVAALAIAGGTILYRSMRK